MPGVVEWHAISEVDTQKVDSWRYTRTVIYRSPLKYLENSVNRLFLQYQGDNYCEIITFQPSRADLNKLRLQVQNICPSVSSDFCARKIILDYFSFLCCLAAKASERGMNLFWQKSNKGEENQKYLPHSNEIQHSLSSTVKTAILFLFIKKRTHSPVQVLMNRKI